MWTFWLIATGVGSMWLVAKHWYGWLLYLLNEVLWFGYSFTIHSQALSIMAVVWFLVGARNLVVTYRKARTHVAS